MDIVVLAVGRMKAGAERELSDRYLDRARKGGAKLGLRGFSVVELVESRASRPAERMAGEAAALRQRLSPGDRVVCLDERGDLANSEDFARQLGEDAASAVARTVFVIGGADGLSPDFLARAARRLAFGRLTWPHQLVRLLLAEQLYRATTILSGHPYHRA